ncbi:MAG: sprT domain-containing protein [Bacteroidales bacterium]|nr:sprT domain-containing protein [Bacteroidales bacterium]
MKQSDKDILRKYLPDGAVDSVSAAIVDHKIAFRISRPRATKLGDYRAAMNGFPHRISVNQNLNPYSFLITFVHELAHLIVFERYGRKVMPHGLEWKQVYHSLMQPYFEKEIFPDDLKMVLSRSVQHAKATDGSDVELTRILKSYNTRQTDPNEVELTQIADGSYFRIADGRVFQKLHVQRKRYKCACLASKRLYLFSPIAGVKPVTDEEMKNFLNFIILNKTRRR